MRRAAHIVQEATRSRFSRPRLNLQQATAPLWFPSSICASCLYNTWTRPTWRRSANVPELSRPLSRLVPPPSTPYTRGRGLNSAARTTVPDITTTSTTHDTVGVTSEPSLERITTAELKRRIKAFEDAVVQSDRGVAERTRIWDAFVAACQHPVTRDALRQAHILKVFRMVCFDGEDVPNLAEKLGFLQTLISQTGWMSLEMYVKNAGILRHREAFNSLEAAETYLAEMRGEGLEANYDTYALLMDALGSQGCGEGAAAVLKMLEAAGGEIDANVYQHVILGYARSNNVERAVAAFREMQERGIAASARNYTTIISCYAKRKEMSVVEELYQEMVEQGLQPTIVTFNVLLKLYFDLDQLDAAQSVFRAIENAGLQPQTDTFNTMISGFVRLKRLDDAVAVYNQMEAAGVAHDKFTFAAMIHGCGQAGMMINAMRYYRDLRRSDVAINYYHFSILQAAFATAKDMQTCQEVFRDMMALYAPTVRNYNILIAGWIRCGDIVNAEAEFNKMKMMAGCEPDAITYRRMIRGYIQAGRVQDALRMYEILRKLKGLTIGVYVHLIDACWNNGLTTTAERLLQSMRDTIPDQTPPYAIYERIAISLLKEGNTTSALQWVDRLERVGYIPREYLYSQLIRTAALALNINQALVLTEKMKRNNIQPSVYVFNHLLTACENTPTAIHSILADMHDAGVVFNHYTYSTLIYLYSKTAPDLTRAWSIWEDYIAALATQLPTPEDHGTTVTNNNTTAIHPAVVRTMLRACAVRYDLDKFKTVWTAAKRARVVFTGIDVEQVLRGANRPDFKEQMRNVLAEGTDTGEA
ncbi:hypothetical protein DFJ77DRAFT_105171 [Powellomyces hirtus]|nr:hypothetical protein DFJ77DRAFT_105171 [Powellomyces hirtus]